MKPKLFFDPVWIVPSFDGTIHDDTRNLERQCFLKFKPPASLDLEQILYRLHSVLYPLGFEIISVAGNVSLQLVIQESDFNIVSGAFSPATLQAQSDPIRSHFEKITGKGLKFQFVDYYLPSPFWQPIRIFKDNSVLSELCNVFAKISGDDLGFYQVLFAPITANWKIEAERQLSIYAKKLSASDQEKFETPMYAVAVRLGGFTTKGQNTADLLNQAQSLINSFSTTDQPVEYLTRSDFYDSGIGNHENNFREHRHMIFRRAVFHTGFLLSSRELSGLITPPTSATRSAPDFMLDPDPIKGLLLGYSGRDKIRLPHELRNENVYIIGMPKRGKSTLIANMVNQDLQERRGFAVIDPHGDLAEDILDLIPKSRIEDVIYFNPSDEQYIIPLNILSASDKKSIDLLADTLIVVFKRLTGSWFERMEDVLKMTVYTLAVSRSKALSDIKKFLVDEAYRERVLSTISNRDLLSYWSLEFANYPKNARDPITYRVNKFLNPISHTKHIFSIPKSTFSFSEIMDKGKIFIANLSKVSPPFFELCGSLLVSLFQLAIMDRARIPIQSRKFFSLYIDEFHRFTTDSEAFKTILSEARKFNLSTVLAHQYTGQAEAIIDAVRGTVSTIISFQIGDNDSPLLSKLCRHFAPADFENLPLHETIIRVSAPDHSFRMKTYPMPQKQAPTNKHAVIEASRKHYAVPLSEIESHEKKTAESKPTPTAEASPQPEQIVSSYTQPTPQAPISEKPTPVRFKVKVPKKAAPLAGTAKQKITHYLKVATYLSREQIIDLVFYEAKYIRNNPKSASAQASTTLRDLIKDKAIKQYPQQYNEQKIYTLRSSKPEPTEHNLAVRDLYVKIIQNGFETSEVEFCPTLADLIPDLAVAFSATDESPIKTLWEYDAGSQWHEQLSDKVKRYARYQTTHRIAFVAASPKRAAYLSKTITAPYIAIADLQTLCVADVLSF